MSKEDQGPGDIWEELGDQKFLDLLKSLHPESIQNFLKKKQGLKIV